MPRDFMHELQLAQTKAKGVRLAIGKVTPPRIAEANEPGSFGPRDEQSRNASTMERNRIHASLNKISPALARSYAQVKADLQDEHRSSWTGTAHEIREVLATMLRMLAPDSEVVKQSWYKQEPNTSGPTQKQRTRFILQLYDVGSKEMEVASKVSNLEDMIGDLVRATYSRASDAAHRAKARREVVRIVTYFDAFAYDLLNLE